MARGSASSSKVPEITKIIYRPDVRFKEGSGWFGEGQAQGSRNVPQLPGGLVQGVRFMAVLSRSKVIQAMVRRPCVRFKGGGLVQEVRFEQKRELERALNTAAKCVVELWMGGATPGCNLTAMTMAKVAQPRKFHLNLFFRATGWVGGVGGDVMGRSVGILPQNEVVLLTMSMWFSREHIFEGTPTMEPSKKGNITSPNLCLNAIVGLDS